jgi:hypothetical protein
MNCQDVQKFAYTYLDAEFDGRERGEFETHLRLCQACRETVERDAMFRDMVRTKLCAVEAPCPTLKTRLQARMDCVEQRRSMTTIVVPMALAASVTVAIVGWQWRVTAEKPRVNQLASASQLPNAMQKPQIAQAQPQPARVALASKAQMVNVGTVLNKMPMVAMPTPQNHPQPGRANGLQLVSANANGSDHLANGSDPGEVLRGAIQPSSLVDRSPFGAVRSEASLRTMARVHAAQLPPEVGGPATKVQRYLAMRMPGLNGAPAMVPPLPLSEGAGVELIGARLAVLGPQLVVIYSYRAYGTPLTVFSRAKVADVDDPEVEATAPDSHDSGVLLDQRAGLHLLHVVSRDRVLTLVSELSASALLPLVPKATWL